MTVESIQREPMPRALVLSFMAGLSWGARQSSELYVSALLKALGAERSEWRA